MSWATVVNEDDGRENIFERHAADLSTPEQYNPSLKRPISLAGSAKMRSMKGKRRRVG